MKINLNNRAVTLIELVVATTLMTIVLMGMFAINNVLNNNNQDYGQRFLVKSSTQTALNHILNDATLATGSAVANNQAIIFPPTVNQAGCFAIHQGANNNIINSAGDVWVVYCLEPAGGAYTSPYIVYSVKTYNPADPSGARGVNATCPGASCLVTNFVGSAYSMTPSYVNNVLSVIIQNCLNNTAATCVPDCTYYPTAPNCVVGGTTDKVNNPEYATIGSTSTPQVSM